jgi:glycine cleavage system H protein
VSKIHGCDLPEDLYYLIDKHVWAKPMGDGTIRVGMTTVATKLAGGSFAAVTVSARKIGREIPQGKSVATVESSKFVGPVPAPVTGELLRANEKLASDPNIVVSDPYGEGWIAEMRANDWDGDKGSLATGPDGLAAYQAKLEADGVSCD